MRMVCARGATNDVNESNGQPCAVLAKALRDLRQMRGLAEMFQGAALQLELQNNFIRYQLRLMTNF